MTDLLFLGIAASPALLSSVTSVGRAGQAPGPYFRRTRVGGRQQLADTTKRPGGREIFSSFLLKINGHFQSFPPKQTVFTCRCLRKKSSSSSCSAQMLPSSGCSFIAFLCVGSVHAPDVGTARLRLLPDAGQVVGLGEDAHLELGIKDFVNRL